MISLKNPENLNVVICVDNMRSVLESAVFETFQISTFILSSFKSI